MANAKPLAVIPHHAHAAATDVAVLVGLAHRPVANREQFQNAAATLRQVKLLTTKLAGMRLAVTGPLTQALHAVNDWFR